MLGRALRLAILIGVLVPASASAGIKATVVAAFTAPTYIAAPPGDTDRLFVVQQSGQIELIKDGGKPTTFLDLSNEVTFVGGEQGLLSMAFAPDYATSGRFYVYYTSKNCPDSPGCDEHVSEFTANAGGDTANPGSEHVLITIPHPNESNHNGGQLQFGPDRDLYISVGDGGGANDTEVNAQHKTTLLGKILRISPQAAGYSIPAGNPFSDGQSKCSTGPRRDHRVAGLPGDLGLRSAQPVAILVRQRDRRHGDRRRRPERGRGDRLSRTRVRGRRQLRLALLRGLGDRLSGAVVGVHPASVAGRPPGADVSAPAELRRRAVLRQRDHRRLRDARSDAAVDQRLLRVRRPR